MVLLGRKRWEKGLGQGLGPSREVRAGGWGPQQVGHRGAAPGGPGGPWGSYGCLWAPMGKQGQSHSPSYCWECVKHGKGEELHIMYILHIILNID